MSEQEAYLLVECGACGHTERMAVDWLHEHLIHECASCGGSIDLREKSRQDEIQRLWNATHHLGPPRRNLP
ncbi:MAG: hypothetical protein MJE12_00860 [Alphaproteobacteria bacterium]|nr:hypothetical protein [Alphaproteobacteria bacterium]